MSKIENYQDLLKQQFNNEIAFIEKRPGITQVYAPFFHEDGDMFDIFIEKTESDNMYRISDHGLTLMRLSYEFDLDTDNKRQIFNKIVSENYGSLENGNVFIEAESTDMFQALLQYSQLISKVTNMDILKRENVKSLFYDMLYSYISEKLTEYKPAFNFTPINSRKDLVVDCSINLDPKPIYMFGVKDTIKAKETVICCLDFLRSNLPFESLIIYENFETLSSKDKFRLLNIADKQYTSLDEFMELAPQYLKRKAG